MGKIKGWKKLVFYNLLRPKRHTINYISTTGYGSVLIHCDYGTRVWNVSIKGKNIDKQKFNTKKEAITYAIKYMRANPNG